MKNQAQRHTGEFATPAAHHHASSQDDIPPPKTQLYALEPISKEQQWFFLRLIAWLIPCWLLLAIVGPIIAFSITHNLGFFTGSIPLTFPFALLKLLAQRLFPPSDNETKIALAKWDKKKRTP